MEVVDWCELPPELIEMVARKITIYADYIRFRAVCMKWSSYLSPTPHHLPPQFPWLMLSSELPQTENENHRDFFDLLENKVHHLNLPEISCGMSSTCYGSSKGWLVLLEKSTNIIILNPLTRIQIQLPPFVLDFNIRNVLHSFIKKVVLSSSPTSQDFVAAASFRLTGELGFCKKGDESWSFIEDARSYCEDVIYYNDSFYAVNVQGSLAICDVISGGPSLAAVIEPPPPPPVFLHEDRTLYLVNSFGELLLVFQYFNFVNGPELGSGSYKTVGFDVYKLDSSVPKWVQVTSLGDRVLFVGRGFSSLCLLASDFSGCEGNCINFTDDYTGVSDDGRRDHDMGVFNLGDGSIKPLLFCTGKSRLSPAPIWVTPNPC